MDHPVDHVVSVEDVWGSRWLRCLFQVSKFNPDQLLTQFSKKDRTWGIDFYMRCFSQLPTEETAALTWSHQNTDKAKSHQHSALYRVEKDHNNNKRLRIRFFKADHPYDLEFPDSFLRERFYECAKALRQFPVWLPSVCPIKASRPLAIEIHGKETVETIGGATNETQEVSGIAKLRASISPTEDVKLWTGTIDLRHGLPNPRSLHEYMPPGVADFYVATFQDVPASLQRNSQLGEMLSKHLGPDYVPLLSTELEAGKRTVAMQVICNKQKALRVSNTGAWTGNLTRSRRQASKGKNPFSGLRKKSGMDANTGGSASGTGTATTDMVSLSFNVNETSLCFIATKIAMLEDDVGEAGIQIRNDTLKQLLTRLELGASSGGDTCQKFDHSFIMGGIGYGCEVENHNWHSLSQLPQSADRLQREVKDNNCLSNFIESDLVMSRTANLNELNLSQRILYKSLPGQVIIPQNQCYRTFHFEAQSGRHMSHGVSHQFAISSQLIYPQALAPPPAKRQLIISSVEYIPPQVGVGSTGPLMLVVYSPCLTNTVKTALVNNQITGLDPLIPATTARIFLERQYVWFSVTTDKEKDFRDIYGTGLLPLSGIIANESVGDMAVEIPIYRGGVSSTASLKCRLSVLVDRSPIMAALKKTEHRESSPRSVIATEENAAWEAIMKLVPLSLADITRKTIERHREERRELEDEDEFDGRADVEDLEEEAWTAIQLSLSTLTEAAHQQATDQGQVVDFENQNRLSIENEELTERNAIIVFHNQHMQLTTQLTQNLSSVRTSETTNRASISAEEDAEFSSLLTTVSASQRGSTELVESHHRTQILKEEAAAMADIVLAINASTESLFSLNQEKQRQSFISQVEVLIGDHVQKEEQTEWETIIFDFEKKKNSILAAAREAWDLRQKRQRDTVEQAEIGPRRLIEVEENDEFSKIFHIALSEYAIAKQSEGERLAKIERHRTGLIQEALDICEEIQQDESVKFEVLLKYEASDRANVLQQLRLQFEKKIQKDLQQQELRTRTNICKSEQELWRRIITSEISCRNEARHQLQARQYHERAASADDESKDRSFHELKEASAWTLLIQSHQIEVAAADSKTQGRIQEEITGRNNVTMEETELWFGMMEIERESRKCARRSHQDRILRALRERSDLEVLESTRRSAIERSEQAFFQTLAEDHVLPDVLTIEYSHSISESEIFQQQQRIPLNEQRPRMLLEREEQKSFDDIVSDFQLGFLDSEIRTLMSQAITEEQTTRAATLEEQNSTWEDILDAFVDEKTVAASHAIKHQVGSQSLLQETEWEEQCGRRECLVSFLNEIEKFITEKENDLRDMITKEAIAIYDDLTPTYKTELKAATRRLKQRELSEDSIRWEEEELRNAISIEEERLRSNLKDIQQEHASVAIKFYTIYGESSCDDDDDDSVQSEPQQCIYSYHSSPSVIPLDTEEESSSDSRDDSYLLNETPDSLPFKQPDSYSSRLSVDALQNFEYSPMSQEGYAVESPFPINSKVQIPEGNLASVLAYDGLVGRVTVSGCDGIQIFDERLLKRCDVSLQDSDQEEDHSDLNIGDRVYVVSPSGEGVVVSLDDDNQLATISYDDGTVRLVPYHLIQNPFTFSRHQTSPSAISYHPDKFDIGDSVRVLSPPGEGIVLSINSEKQQVTVSLNTGIDRQFPNHLVKLMGSSELQRQATNQTTTTSESSLIKHGDTIHVISKLRNGLVVDNDVSEQLLLIGFGDEISVLIPRQFITTNDTDRPIPLNGDAVTVSIPEGNGIVKSINKINQIHTISFEDTNIGIQYIPSHVVFQGRSTTRDDKVIEYEKILNDNFGKVVHHTPSKSTKIVIGCGTNGEVVVMNSDSSVEQLPENDIIKAISEPSQSLYRTISNETSTTLIVGTNSDGRLITISNDNTVQQEPIDNIFCTQPTVEERLYPVNSFVDIKNSTETGIVVGHCYESHQIAVMNTNSCEVELYSVESLVLKDSNHLYPMGSQVVLNTSDDRNQYNVIGHFQENDSTHVILLHETSDEIRDVIDSDPTIYCNLPRGTPVKTIEGDDAIVVSVQDSNVWISQNNSVPDNPIWTSPVRVPISDIFIPEGTLVRCKDTNQEGQVCSSNPLQVRLDDNTEQDFTLNDIEIKFKKENANTDRTYKQITTSSNLSGSILFEIDNTAFIEQNTSDGEITAIMKNELDVVNSREHLFPLGCSVIKESDFDDEVVGYYKDHLVVKCRSKIILLLPSVDMISHQYSVNTIVDYNTGQCSMKGMVLGPPIIKLDNKIPILIGNDVVLVAKNEISVQNTYSGRWSIDTDTPMIVISNPIPELNCSVIVNNSNTLQLHSEIDLLIPNDIDTLQSEYKLHMSTSVGIIVGYHLAKKQIAIDNNSEIKFYRPDEIVLRSVGSVPSFVAKQGSQFTYKIVNQQFDDNIVIGCRTDSGLFQLLRRNEIIPVADMSFPRIGEVVQDSDMSHHLVVGHQNDTAQVMLTDLGTGCFHIKSLENIHVDANYVFPDIVGKRVRYISSGEYYTAITIDPSTGRCVVKTNTGEFQTVLSSNITLDDNSPVSIMELSEATMIEYDNEAYKVLLNVNNKLLCEKVSSPTLIEIDAVDASITKTSSDQKFNFGETVQDLTGNLYSVVGEQPSSNNVIIRDRHTSVLQSIHKSLVSHSYNTTAYTFKQGSLVVFQNRLYRLLGFAPLFDSLILHPACGGPPVVATRQLVCEPNPDDDDLLSYCPPDVGSYVRIGGFDSEKRFKVITADHTHGMLTCIDMDGQFHNVEQHTSVECSLPLKTIAVGSIVELDESGNKFTVVGFDSVLDTVICLSHVQQKSLFITIPSERLILVSETQSFSINDAVQLLNSSEKYTILGTDPATNRMITLSSSNSEIVLLHCSEIFKCESDEVDFKSSIVQELGSGITYGVLNYDSKTGYITCLSCDGIPSIRLFRKSDVVVVGGVSDHTSPAIGSSITLKDGTSHTVIENDECTGRVVCLSIQKNNQIDTIRLLSCECITETIPQSDVRIAVGTVVQHSSEVKTGIVIGYYEPLNRYFVRFNDKDVILLHSEVFIATTDQLNLLYPVGSTVSATHPISEQPSQAIVLYVDVFSGMVFVRFSDSVLLDVFFTKLSLNKLPTSNLSEMYPLQSVLSVSTSSLKSRETERYLVTGHGTDGTSIIGYNSDFGWKIIQEMEILTAVTPQNATLLQDRFPSGSCAADSHSGTVGIVVGYDLILQRVVIQDTNTGTVSLIQADQSAVVSHKTSLSTQFPLGTVVDNIVTGRQGVVVGHSQVFNSFSYVITKSTTDESYYSFPEEQLRLSEPSISSEELKQKFPKYCLVSIKTNSPKTAVVLSHLNYGMLVVRITEGIETGSTSLINHSSVQLLDYASHEVGVPITNDKIPLHTTIQIKDLTTATELNGCSGKVVGYEDERYIVHVDYELFNSIGHNPTGSLHVRVLSENNISITSHNDELSRIKRDMQRSAIEAEQSRTAYITDVMDIQRESNAAKKEMHRMAAELEHVRSENSNLKNQLSAQRTTPVFTPGCTVEVLSSGLQGEILHIDNSRGCIMLEGHSAPQWMSLDLLRAGRCLDKDLSKARSEIARLQSLLSGAFSREEQLTKQVSEKDDQIKKTSERVVESTAPPSISDSPSDLTSTLISARKRVEWLSRGVASSPGAPSVSKSSPPPTELVASFKKRTSGGREGFWEHNTDLPLPPSFYPDSAEKAAIDPE